MSNKIITVERKYVFTNELPFFIQKHKVSNFPLHRHDFYELEFVKTTGGVNVTEGIENKLDGNRLFIYMPHVTHEYISGEWNYIYNVAFSEVFIASEYMNFLFSLKNCCNLKLSDEEAEIVENDLIILNTIYQGNAPLKKELLKTRFEALIIYLLNIYNEKISGINTLYQKYGDIRDILAYISINFNKKITIKELAEIIHISPKYFSTYFKKQYGAPYKTYITGIRMKYAMDRVCCSENSISDISNETGFSSESNFIKAFTVYYNNSPSYYRKK
jgi:AraC-like DNA-binding protein